LTANQIFVNPVNISQGTLQIAVGSGSLATWNAPLTLAANGTLAFQVGTFVYAPASLSLAKGATLQIGAAAGNFNIFASSDVFTDSLHPSIHANVINNSTLNITAGNQNVASLTGYGHTVVAAGASLTADSIVQDGSSAYLVVNGTVTIRPAITPNVASILGVLTMGRSTAAYTGLLDLNNTDLIVRSTTGLSSDIAAEITQGFDGGLWNGSGGITSTAARSSIGMPHQMALAYFTGAQYAEASGNLLFDGQPFALTDLLVRYTLVGDANADGTVDMNDLNTVLNHLGTTTPHWTDGNFDYAPTIDLTDLNDVLNNLGQTFANNGTSIAPPTPTPEPTSLLLASLTALPLLTRRRK
jgi:hypothetical protein